MNMKSMQKYSSSDNRQRIKVQSFVRKVLKRYVSGIPSIISTGIETSSFGCDQISEKELNEVGLRFSRLAASFEPHRNEFSRHSQ